METKQLASINLNNSQLKASKSAALAEISDSKQQSSFETGLNKQIEQLRERKREEGKIIQVKDDKNQRDSSSKLNSNIPEKSSSRAQREGGGEGGGEREADKSEDVASKKSVSGKSEGTKKADFTDEPLEPVESIRAAGEVDSQLPLAGIILPPLQSTPGVQLSGNVNEKRMTTELPAQDKLAADLLNGVNRSRYQSTSGASLQVSGTGAAADSTSLVEQPAILVGAQTALNQTNKTSMQFYQPAQTSKIPDEMPAVDLIAQTTRLVQVPLTTALSKSIVEGGGSENSLQQGTLQALATGATGIIPGTATPVANAAVNNLTSLTGTHLSSPDWSNQMTQKVSMMLQGGIQKAEIKLNPAHLGPMEIKLSMSDDRASISFVAQHAPVRDAIEQAMPRLREMLEEQGLDLVDVEVSTYSEQQPEQQNSGQQSDEVSDSQRLRASEAGSQSDNMQAESTGSINLAVDRVINIYA